MARDGPESGTRVGLVELAVGTPPRRLFIADGFVAPDAARAIFERLRGLAYTLDDADREDTREFNHFKHDFDIRARCGDPLVLLLADRARALLRSQGIHCGAIHRIYANLNMFGDFQFAHEDGDGWTALLFANAEWREDWGGEFIAYTGEASPFDLAVSPRPGRLLLFDGRIRHRGGVPSKFCHEARISLAVKFRRSEDGDAARPS